MNSAWKELFPPGVPPILKWRLAVFAILMLFLFHIGWACGWLEKFGFGSGFASAAEIEVVETNVRDMRVTLIEQDILNAKESECTSTDPKAGRFFQSRVLERSREYFQLVGVQFDIPPCRNGDDSRR